MGNMPPYQPDQPGQEHEYQPERPHDYRQDQQPTYQAQPVPGDQASQWPAQAADARQDQRQHMRIRRRPCGVVLMSLFLAAQGVFMMISGVFGILGLVVLVFDISRGSTLLMHGLVSFALGILSLIFAFGMIMLTRWAFWAAVIIAFFNLMMSLTVLLQTGFASFGYIISGIFSLIVLFYFVFNPETRAAFTKDAPVVEFR